MPSVQQALGWVVSTSKIGMVVHDCNASARWWGRSSGNLNFLNLGYPGLETLWKEGRGGRRNERKRKRKKEEKEIV